MADKRIGNRYRVIEKIGEGGMGAVYRAFDEQYPREVAVKRLRIVGANDSQVEQFIIRFEREARVQGQLQHPNIVRGLDYGHDEEGVYFVMEYLQNGSMKDVVGSWYKVEKAVELILPIAEALAYLHERGFVHRDVKPANILFDENKNPMLSDFGIIKLSEALGEKTLTATGAAIGTPTYMAPELIRGEASPKVDQYALGIILFELLLGKKPYVGKTAMETMLMQQSAPLPNPNDIRPDLPQKATRFLQKVLSKNPNNRFGSMGEFIEALEKLDTNEGDSPLENTINPVSEEATVFVETGSNAEVYSDETELVPEGRAGGRKKRLIIGIPLAILFVLTVLLVVFQDHIFGESSNAVSSSESTAPASFTALPTLQETVTKTVTATHVDDTPTVTVSEEPDSTDIFTPTHFPAGAVKDRSVDQMPLVFVPSGGFRMGLTEEEVTALVDFGFIDDDDRGWLDSAQPAREVFLDAFWIDQYEVSNQQFVTYLNEMAESKGTGYWWIWREGSNTEIRYSMSEWVVDDGYDDHPAVALNWNAAASYCAWVGGRLPTEAEWEKAARGEESFLFPWGNERPSCEKVNFIAREGTYCVQDTMPVDSYPEGISPYGAYQMAGNVWEWVSDWYGEDSYLSTVVENPTGVAFGDNHVIRGGAWNESELHLSGGARGNRTFNGTVRFGFRCVMDAD